MGIAVFPAAGGGGIKLVQRGTASGSGNVTITLVDIAKAFVNIFGTASTGTVSASFGLNAAGETSFNYVGVSAPVGGYFFSPNASINTTSRSRGDILGSTASWNATANVNAGSAGNVNAGSTNLVAAIVQGFLANGTTLTVSGACRWEVVEFA